MTTLLIGQVLKPQGIRGEIKVKPFTDSPEEFQKLSRIFLDGAEYKILSVRCAGGAAYLGLRGIPDRNAAELLRGKEITIPRDEAPAPEEGRYYIADLLGSKLVSESGEELGTLTDIRGAATDIYTVTKDGKDILFPAVKGVIEKIDVENKMIVINAKRFSEVAVL